MKHRKLHVGDWVEVRSKDEILKTLDRNGRLEGMPFMPEMFAYCGKRFRVYRRAHKTCDTVNDYMGRKLSNTIHIEETRCDGQSHGGCEASCLIFWKTDWVRPVDGPGAQSNAVAPRAKNERPARPACCTEDDVIAGAHRPSDDGEPAYICQATQVPDATEPLPWWSLGQYWEDITSGNVGAWRVTKTFIYMGYRHCLVNLGIGLGPLLMWFYDRFHKIWRGTPYPHRCGKLPAGTRTPSGQLDLEPGDLVRIKSFDDIRSTCDQLNRNRGMSYDAEMVPYCGGTYRVLKRVHRILNEKTGKMQEMKNPCTILDNVICQGRYADRRAFCPRGIYPYWRDVWLEKVEAETPGQNNPPAEAEPNAVLAERGR